MSLILLTFALVLFLLAAGVPPGAADPWRLRIMAFGLAAWVASQYPFFR
jgi:hypothetical protein